jgi:hypothetical protein
MPHAVILNTASKKDTTGGTFADVLTANSQDSLAVPNFVNGGARVLHMWGMDSASVAEIAWTNSRVDSIHDPTFGIRFNIASLFPGGAGKPAAQALIKPPATVPVFSGDTNTFTVTSTANDDVLVSWLTEYDDLPGTEGQFARWDQVQQLRFTTIGLRCAPVASATEGAYGTARALNADDTRLTGGKYYAILGWTVQTPVTTISVKANTWGNTRLGLPQGSLNLGTDMGFVDMSLALNKPLIPIINGYDAGNVFLEVADNIASTSPKVDLLMYELTRSPF